MEFIRRNHIRTLINLLVNEFNNRDNINWYYLNEQIIYNSAEHIIHYKLSKVNINNH